MGRPFTILFVEDDALVRNVVIRMLSEMGFCVLTAKDGWEALSVLDKERVDVLFTDIMMPDMDGVELARLARQMKPGLKVLFATGYPRKAMERGAFAHTGIDVLLKPFRERELSRDIEALLSG